ncbi:GatB/YqeY domain-containing protein [Vagococcus carniphilus]|uniref:GatB/YqeY domain-containing protein n=1 Tax=Vagococcus carniphilus TaxID=218144 RepID=A0AAW8U638_9ENTE|nr:GatB/YqeY domain-containing protein [Vagococcus carniphilus]MDT2829688.1 GatB/YqeY domain-containing protein [Vagococcus carniphilus]MDT2833610.1 GatB/YqeY domain-containing protein [Vagococcus carniphilus]MDT2853205.1 GatB/YqeY domain-containing protein [Vagococcus carniphilus]
MSLLETLNDDIKVAMKSKDKEALAILRMIKTSIQNEQINKGEDLSPEEELTLVSREMKQRKESLSEFEKAGRSDLIEQASFGISIVARYLPEQLSDEELKSIIAEAIASVDATSMKDFGKVMGVVMPKTKGKADGQKINTLVKELIS